MKLFWDTISLLFFMWVVYKIINAYALLRGISDDIYAIQKKLRLPTEIRTPFQRERSTEETIKNYIYKDYDLPRAEEMTYKETGFTKKELKKYKTYIEITTNNRKKAKYCRDCDVFFDTEYEKKCDICEGSLFLVKDAWKNGKFISQDEK